MANNTHGFVNEIKNYELIRGLIRQLFQYGDSSTKELADSKRFGSTTNLYAHLKRLQNYLKDDRLQTNAVKAAGVTKKTTRLIYDPLTYPINNLTETFQECIFDINDIVFYFTLMQMFTTNNYEPVENIKEFLFHEFEDPFTLPNLIEDFFEIIREKRKILYENGYLNIPKNMLDAEPFSEAYFRRYFNKLKNEMGIFENTEPVTDHAYEKDGKKSNTIKVKNEDNEYFYKLTSDIFQDIGENTAVMDNLLDMVRFMYNQSDIAVPGWQLANTLTTYMFCKGMANIDTKEEPIFQFMDTNVLNVIDNDIFWELINAIHSHNVISFDYTTGDEPTITVYPIRVIAERQYGRQYLFAYHYNSGEYYIYRLDKISNVELLKKDTSSKYSFLTSDGCISDADIDKRLNELYQRIFANALNIDIRNHENPQNVLIHFNTNTKNRSVLLPKVTNKTNHGEVINETETGFDYKITVPNTIEIIPWIRSFGAQAVVDAETNPELYSKIKNELSEIIKRYESV